MFGFHGLLGSQVLFGLLAHLVAQRQFVGAEGTRLQRGGIHHTGIGDDRCGFDELLELLFPAFSAAHAEEHLFIGRGDLAGGDGVIDQGTQLGIFGLFDLVLGGGSAVQGQLVGLFRDELGQVRASSGTRGVRGSAVQNWR